MFDGTFAFEEADTIARFAFLDRLGDSKTVVHDGIAPVSSIVPLMARYSSLLDSSPNQSSAVRAKTVLDTNLFAEQAAFNAEISATAEIRRIVIMV